MQALVGTTIMICWRLLLSLLHLCRESGKPCALLMPNYVYMKVRGLF